MILVIKGFRVLGSANNGAKAFEMLKKLNEEPDIILMDHRMPIKNGLEITRELINGNIKSKIIFISADNSIRDEALKVGAKFFIQKPFSQVELIEKINIALQN